MNVKIISAILVLALASMACGFSFDLPEQVKAGPEVKEEISVADPKEDETRLLLSFGAGNLNLSTGAKNLVDGTVVYNVEDLKPEIIEDGAQIEIKQGNFQGLPPFDGMKNEWDLQLGSSPMELEISAGAYEGDFEFGGLALTNLTINDGAADVSLSFSELNLAEMSEFNYSTWRVGCAHGGAGERQFRTLHFQRRRGQLHPRFFRRPATRRDGQRRLRLERSHAHHSAGRERCDHHRQRAGRHQPRRWLVTKGQCLFTARRWSDTHHHRQHGRGRDHDREVRPGWIIRM
ncbi:MAG: hypothetical protein IPM31_07120 [Anaerolineae bacterium]|nr:hypothetical protein [Anaerolineae bacterium]